MLDAPWVQSHPVCDRVAKAEKIRWKFCCALLKTCLSTAGHTLPCRDTVASLVCANASYDVHMVTVPSSPTPPSSVSLGMGPCHYITATVCQLLAELQAPSIWCDLMSAIALGCFWRSQRSLGPSVLCQVTQSGFGLRSLQWSPFLA
jgi:hypothetical protein